MIEFQAAFEVRTFNIEMYAYPTVSSQNLLISTMVCFHLLAASRDTDGVYTPLIWVKQPIPSI